MITMQLLPSCPCPEHAKSGRLTVETVPHGIQEPEVSICGVLSNHYGDNAGLFVSIWNSRTPLDKVKPIEVIVNSDVSEGKITTLAYVEDGMRNWH